MNERFATQMRQTRIMRILVEMKKRSPLPKDWMRGAFEECLRDIHLHSISKGIRALMEKEILSLKMDFE